MKKTVDHCNITVDELDCKLVLVFHCKHGQERKRESERERKRQKEKLKQRERKAGKEIMNDDILEHKLLCIY